MNSGQEGVMFVREQRVVEEGVEMTSKTLIAATDEGVAAFQFTTVEASTLPQPRTPRRPEAWPAQPPVAAPTILESSHGDTPDVDDVRKKSCSDCLKVFCCLYDTNHKWYSLRGKGVWCVLFLLLGYLIFGVFVLAAGIVAIVCAICYALSELEHYCMDSEDDR